MYASSIIFKFITFNYYCTFAYIYLTSLRYDSNPFFLHCCSICFHRTLDVHVLIMKIYNGMQDLAICTLPECTSKDQFQTRMHVPSHPQKETTMSCTLYICYMVILIQKHTDDCKNIKQA